MLMYWVLGFVITVMIWALVFRFFCTVRRIEETLSRDEIEMESTKQWTTAIERSKASATAV